ncbi:hypothetical protein WME90_10440 [Sorangium sp. So ce375]|uniref:hypothetical protein n=1 Tax=Sorangium sp. So ce375 TaxID=3133306 RepID=UPI003F5C251B
MSPSSRSRPPHPATIVQPKPAIGAPAARPPHPATTVQKKPAIGGNATKPPHPATAVQKKPAIGGNATKPPHPATLATRFGRSMSVAQRSAELKHDAKIKGLDPRAISNQDLPVGDRQGIVQTLKTKGYVSPTIVANAFLDYGGRAVHLVYHIDFTGATHAGERTPHIQIIMIREAGSLSPGGATRQGLPVTRELTRGEIFEILGALPDFDAKTADAPDKELTMPASVRQWFAQVSHNYMAAVDAGRKMHDIFWRDYVDAKDHDKWSKTIDKLKKR